MANNALGLRVLTDTSARLKTVNRDFANSIRKNLRAAIQAEGAGVLSAVKSAASWSTGGTSGKRNPHTSIPEATALSIRYNVKGASVRIQVNHTKAPHARPLELGNRQAFNEIEIASRIAGGARNRREAIKQGRRGGTGIISGQVLRHPVFHKSGEPGGWATQPTRPFFFPTVAAQKGHIDQAMEKAAVQIARDAGFS